MESEQKGTIRTSDVDQEKNEADIQTTNNVLSKMIYTDKTPIPCAEDRIFIKHGVLSKVCRSKNKTYNFFLFSDILCYGERLRDKYVIHQTLPLNSAFEVQDIWRKESGYPENSMAIITSTKSFVVLSTHGAEKSGWINTLRKVAEKRCRYLSSKGLLDETVRKAPVYTPDHFFENCQLCAIKFTVYKRRHHCRICGKVVCGGCSGNKATLAADSGKKRKKEKGASKAAGRASARKIETKKKRVCDLCYRKLKAPPTKNTPNNTSTPNVINHNRDSEQGIVPGPDKIEQKAQSSIEDGPVLASRPQRRSSSMSKLPRTTYMKDCDITEQRKGSSSSLFQSTDGPPLFQAPSYVNGVLQPPIIGEMASRIRASPVLRSQTDYWSNRGLVSISDIKSEPQTLLATSTTPANTSAPTITVVRQLSARKHKPRGSRRSCGLPRVSANARRKPPTPKRPTAKPPPFSAPRRPVRSQVANEPPSTADLPLSEPTPGQPPPLQVPAPATAIDSVPPLPPVIVVKPRRVRVKSKGPRRRSMGLPRVAASPKTKPATTTRPPTQPPPFSAKPPPLAVSRGEVVDEKKSSSAQPVPGPPPIPPPANVPAPPSLTIINSSSSKRMQKPPLYSCKTTSPRTKPKHLVLKPNRSIPILTIPGPPAPPSISTPRSKMPKPPSNALLAHIRSMNNEEPQRESKEIDVRLRKSAESEESYYESSTEEKKHEEKDIGSLLAQIRRDIQEESDDENATSSLSSS